MSVRNTASLIFLKFSVPACHAIRKAPAAPTAADSVAVVMPNKITPSTTSVSVASGITDDTSMRRISNCSASMRQ
ncbi:hypothetical protein D3C78_1933370 [compost metagenome]